MYACLSVTARKAFSLSLVPAGATLWSSAAVAPAHMQSPAPAAATAPFLPPDRPDTKAAGSCTSSRQQWQQVAIRSSPIRQKQQQQPTAAGIDRQQQPQASGNSRRQHASSTYSSKSYTHNSHTMHHTIATGHHRPHRMPSHYNAKVLRESPHVMLNYTGTPHHMQPHFNSAQSHHIMS